MSAGKCSTSLGHFLSRRYCSACGVLADLTRQIGVRCEVHFLKRCGSFSEILDSYRLHVVCKFETEYLRIEV
jgi:hypothetical protein